MIALSNNLAGRDNLLESSIDTEAADLIAADNSEMIARIAADNNLQGQVTTNINDINALQGRVTVNENNITSLENADVTHQANLDAESTARANADTTLQTNIDAEIDARQAPQGRRSRGAPRRCFFLHR